MSPHERQQACLLYRHFLSRLVDLEWLAARSDMSALWSQIVALLAAFSFVFVVLKMEQLWVHHLSPAQELVTAWGDQEFLIATTITVTGLFAVLTWNTIFPDKRDALVLSPLPVRTRTITLSKLAALLSALGIAVLAVNSFTGLAAPFLLPTHAGAFFPLRAFAAYAVTMAAVALFIFSALVTLQALTLQLLPYRLFLSLSAYLQMAVLVLVLIVYFLTPPLATVTGLTAPEHQMLLAWLPSFWFLGLWQELLGNAPSFFAPYRSGPFIT